MLVMQETVMLEIPSRPLNGGRWIETKIGRHLALTPISFQTAEWREMD
jgi:hypothetical protein